MKSNTERLRCHDQDVLNYLFKNSKLVLPIRYNVLNEYWFDLCYSLISWEFDEQILEAQAHPAIIHFTGIPKPWYKNCKHPWKKEFDKISTFMENSIKPENTLNISKINSLATGTAAANRST